MSFVSCMFHVPHDSVLIVNCDNVRYTSLDKNVCVDSMLLILYKINVENRS